MVPVLTLAGLSLAVWAYLILFRGGFWRADVRLEGTIPDSPAWPAVVALVPARDEAPVIGDAVAALLAQAYPGDLRVIVIDDGSEDGTAAVAEAAGARAGAPARLAVIAARPPAPGWTGKLWALSEGLRELEARNAGGAYLWLTDADIAHEPATLRRLVAKAEHDGLYLVSLMARLSCTGWWARLLIPPFVYFFQMLYPFTWVADPRRRTAAAAGGCVLVKAEALAAAGGFAAIKGELIDDCALAGRVKDVARAGSGSAGGFAEAGGRAIWLGLAETSRSLRPYAGLKPIWDMVARSAYTQLRHAPLLLLGTLLGMGLAFLAPPLIVLGAGLHGDAAAALLGLAAWSLMAVSALPTYRLYRQPVWAPAFLPLAAALYCAMTLDSALRHWRGRGGRWKGRDQAAPLEERRAGR